MGGESLTDADDSSSESSAAPGLQRGGGPQALRWSTALFNLVSASGASCLPRKAEENVPESLRRRPESGTIAGRRQRDQAGRGEATWFQVTSFQSPCGRAVRIVQPQLDMLANRVVVG